MTQVLSGFGLALSWCHSSRHYLSSGGQSGPRLGRAADAADPRAVRVPWPFTDPVPEPDGPPWEPFFRLLVEIAQAISNRGGDVVAHTPLRRNWL